jgi:release factor glutamine methyltransferase
VTVRDELTRAESRAREAASEATSWDARVLLSHVLGHRPLALDPRGEVSLDAASRFDELWGRRIEGAPVQHLVGEWDFFGRPFFVDARALVPRPETELLIETALAEAPEARSILDLGTGSGVLAITWLLERPDEPESRAVAVDESIEALELARANAFRHGVSDRLDLVAGDWATALTPGERFDVAISNPPYLRSSDAAALPRTVGEHDPPRALFAGEDGLDAIRRLLDEVPRHIRSEAPFAFEIGSGQADAVALEVRRRGGWTLDRIVPDLSGIPRVCVLRRR